MMHVHSLSRLQETLAKQYLPLVCLSRCSTPSGDVLFEHSHTPGVCQFDERFLQALWNEQPLARELTTVDGRSVQILAPGRWNLEPGPDFRDALIQIDGREQRGDVEIHREVRDWFRHGHERDPRYAHVLLHVVWQEGPAADQDGLPPCLEMQPFFNPSRSRLATDIKEQGYPRARQFQAGPCARHFAALSDRAVREVLAVAGLARFREKVAEMRRRIIAQGVDQTCYEALFEALGYKSNRQPFRQLAAALTIHALRTLDDQRCRTAALFGVAGLLPDPTQIALPPEAARLAEGLWDAWWPLGYARLDLPWVRATSRPTNTPERRLAAGLAVLDAWGWQPARVLKATVENGVTPVGLLKGLMAALEVRSPWEGYVHFARRLRPAARLLGRSRKCDIVVNILLPLMRATLPPEDGHPTAELVEGAYLASPRLQGCRPMDETAHRLFVPPSRGQTLAKTACEQQGLLALHHHFCQNWIHDCRNCPFASPETFAKIVVGQ